MKANSLRKRHERAQQPKEFEEESTARDLHLGRYLHFLRRLVNLSQEEAAAQAGLSRISWVRIENGKQNPRPGKIPAIAKVLNVAPAILFRRAGYAVPEEYSKYNQQQSQKEFDLVLRMSKSLGEFLYEMSFIWRKHHEQSGQSVSTPIDLTYTQVLALVRENLTTEQSIQLAHDLFVEGTQEWMAAPSNLKKLLDHISHQHTKEEP